MTSRHQLIAIIVVWIALAAAAVVLFAENLPSNTIMVVSFLLVVGAVSATMFITRSGRRSDERREDT